jgi:hypothetical protein
MQVNLQNNDSQVFLNMTQVYGVEYTLNFFSNMYWYNNQYNVFLSTFGNVSPKLQEEDDIPPLDYFDFNTFFNENEINNEDKYNDMISKTEGNTSNNNMCECKVCGARFASTDGVRKHCYKNHPSLMKNVTRGKPEQYCVRVVVD